MPFYSSLYISSRVVVHCGATLEAGTRGAGASCFRAGGKHWRKLVDKLSHRKRLRDRVCWVETQNLSNNVLRLLGMAGRHSMAMRGRRM